MARFGLQFSVIVEARTVAKLSHAEDAAMVACGHGVGTKVKYRGRIVLNIKDESTLAWASNSYDDACVHMDEQATKHRAERQMAQDDAMRRMAGIGG